LDYKQIWPAKIDLNEINGLQKLNERVNEPRGGGNY